MNLMRNRFVIVAYRAALSALTLVALAVQLSVASRNQSFHPANFFGYFTILSNSLAALILLAAAVNAATPSHRLDVARGAATLYLVMVGAIFSVLLASLESDVIGWVNIVLHYFMPLAVSADWIVNPPRTRITVRETVAWLTFPLAYVIYTLVRGSIVHWYPYPFLNADSIGWPMVAGYCAGIFVITLILAAVVSVIGNARWAQNDRRLRGSGS